MTGPLTRQLVPAFVLLLATVTPRAAAAQAPAGSCDQACLTKVMSVFVDRMTTGKPASVPLAQDAEIRENARAVPLDATAWRQVKAVRSIMTFADAVTANVVSRAGVELADGKPGYISTRLKVSAGGRVTDVELSADVSPRVVSSYVWRLGPVYTTNTNPNAFRKLLSRSEHCELERAFDRRVSAETRPPGHRLSHGAWA